MMRQQVSLTSYVIIYRPLVQVSPAHPEQPAASLLVVALALAVTIFGLMLSIAALLNGIALPIVWSIALLSSVGGLGLSCLSILMEVWP